MEAPQPCASLAELVANFEALHSELGRRLKASALPYAKAGLRCDLTLRFRGAQNGDGIVELEMSKLMK